MRCLIVDDSRIMRRSASRVAESLGFEVDFAEDGLQASGMIRQQQYTVIITDLNMPRMNGLSLVGLVRKNPSNAGVAVVVVSSESSEGERAKGEKVGVDRWLSKPIVPADLSRAILEALDERGATLATAS